MRKEPMSIQEFRNLLEPELAKEDSPLLKELCRLTVIETPQDVAKLAEEENWEDWTAV